MATSDSLKIADLKDTKSALWGARVKWRDIGSFIGVDEATLDTLRGKDHGESLNGILSHWLRGVHKPNDKNSKPRTWRTLIDALRYHIVNEGAMANELEAEKYPGTTPKVIDQRRDQPDVSSATHTDLTSSSSMSDEDFFKSKGISEKDCKTLTENGITASGFLLCDAEDFDDIGLTKIGKKLLLKTFTDLKASEGDRSHDGAHGKGKALSQHSKKADGKDEPAVNGEAPTIEELVLLKYTDNGKKHKLRIIDAASHKWKDIASLICGGANVTTKLEDKHRGDPNECLRQTFIEYFINKKPQGYTQDWNGLIELLDDIDLETLAKNVKHALATKV